VTKRLQRFGNLFVIVLLRSPLHRLLSRSLVLVTYRGRRSGRSFTVPVMYAESTGELIVLVGHPERKSWWRNLREGAPVELRLRGRRLHGTATVTDAEAAAPYIARYPRMRTAVTPESQPTFVRISGLQPSPANRSVRLRRRSGGRGRWE
jgi:deazaflavin-dependent oxidoreductase (nitroreductase family)